MTVWIADVAYDSRAFLFYYSSLTTPTQTWAYDGVLHNRTLLLEAPAPAYNRSLYTTER